jgi:hypothetical protein
LLRTVSRSSLLLASLLSAAAATAQVAVGDIAVTGFSANTFGVIRGTTVTSYVTPGFQGNGNAGTVLWDPVHPNDFLIGGDGFVGRATVTGPGTSTYVRLTNAVGYVVQMSWDQSGGVILIDAGTSQVRRLDPVSGVVVDLSAGTQPWGIDANAGAINPASGDVVVGGNGALYLLRRGTTLATTIVTGLGGYVSGVTFDRVTGEAIATVLTVNRLVRVTGSTATIMTSSLSGPNAVDIDQNGDFIIGGGVGQIVREARTGGAPAPVANYTGPITDLAVVRPDGFGMPFGQGCNGVAGPILLSATGPYQVGSTVTMTSVNHAPSALGVVILGFSNTMQASTPLPFLLDPLLGTSNCRLYTSIDATVIAFSSASSPTSIVFPVSITPAFAGQRFYAQHACFEAVAGGLSWSNGLAVRIP